MKTFRVLFLINFYCSLHFHLVHSVEICRTKRRKLQTTNWKFSEIYSTKLSKAFPLLSLKFKILIEPGISLEGSVSELFSGRKWWRGEQMKKIKLIFFTCARTLYRSVENLPQKPRNFHKVSFPFIPSESINHRLTIVCSYRTCCEFANHALKSRQWGPIRKFNLF